MPCNIIIISENSGDACVLCRPSCKKKHKDRNETNITLTISYTVFSDYTCHVYQKGFEKT